MTKLTISTDNGLADLDFKGNPIDMAEAILQCMNDNEIFAALILAAVESFEKISE